MSCSGTSDLYAACAEKKRRLHRLRDNEEFEEIINQFTEDNERYHTARLRDEEISRKYEIHCRRRPERSFPVPETSELLPTIEKMDSPIFLSLTDLEERTRRIEAKCRCRPQRPRRGRQLQIKYEKFKRI